MLFNEMTAVFCERHMKRLNILRGKMQISCAAAGDKCSKTHAVMFKCMFVYFD